MDYKVKVPNLFSETGRKGDCQFRWIGSKLVSPVNALSRAVFPLGGLPKIGDLPILVGVQVVSLPLNLYESRFLKTQASRMLKKGA